MGKLLKDTKQFYYDLINEDDDGYTLVTNEKIQATYQLSTEEEYFIKNYMSLILTTNIVSDITKEYIKVYTFDSDRKIAEYLVKESKRNPKAKELNFNTVVAMLQYDEKKLQRFFKVDMLQNIKDKTYSEISNISIYKEDYNGAFAKYGKVSELYNKILFEVPVNEINSNLSDSDFDMLLEMIKPYSKVVMKQMVEAIPKKMIAYLGFLLCSNDKSGLDKERYKKLERLLTEGLTQGELNEIQKSLEQPEEKPETTKKEYLEKPHVETTGSKNKITDLGEPEETLTEEPEEYPIVYDVGGGYYKVIKYKGDDYSPNITEKRLKELYPVFDMSKVRARK